MEELLPVLIAIIWFGYKIYKKNAEPPKAVGPDTLYDPNAGVPKGSAPDILQSLFNDFIAQPNKNQFQEASIQEEPTVEETRFSPRFAQKQESKSTYESKSSDFMDKVPANSASIEYNETKIAKANQIQQPFKSAPSPKSPIFDGKAINLKEAMIYDVIFRRPNY